MAAWGALPSVQTAIFIRVEPNFTLHCDRQANRVMVSAWQVMPQLVGELEGIS